MVYGLWVFPYANHGAGIKKNLQNWLINLWGFDVGIHIPATMVSIWDCMVLLWYCYGMIWDDINLIIYICIYIWANYNNSLT